MGIEIDVVYFAFVYSPRYHTKHTVDLWHAAQAGQYAQPVGEGDSTHDTMQGFRL